MRTDVKIGVAAALLLVLAFVGWRMLADGSGDDKAGDANSGDGSLVYNGNPGGSDGSQTSSPGSPLPNFGSPRTGGGGSASSPEPAPTTPSPAPTVTPSYGETSPEPATPTAPEPPIPPISSTPEPATPTSPEPYLPPISVTPEPATPAPAPTVTPSLGSTTPELTPSPPISPIITPAPSVTPGVTVERTYTVQKGDSGFWTIAEKEYGNGKYYYLIQQANPGVSSSSLRIGSKLVIPPLPSPTRTGGTVTEGSGTAPGGVEITPNGQRIYVVQKGDSGFWGIAAKQYGNGKYYYLIAKANPNVSSNSLKPGDRLVLPEKPAATTTTGTSGTTVTAGAGQSLYTVTKEDSAGLWGIAKKQYGNGAYYKVIADANPGVKSSSLKVGQKLIIPELTEEMKKAATGTTAAPRSPAPASPAPKRSGVEDIGPTPKFN